MQITENTALMLALAVGVLLLVGLIAWSATRRKRTRALADRFGPEYERTVAEIGKRGRAEAELLARQKRVEGLKIHPLTTADRDRFADLWMKAQAHFVDSPPAAVAEADALVVEVMNRRGYPMADFEQRAADISVDHPKVVQEYRAARAIAERNRTNSASTEDLRQAVIHYRALFEDLLEQKPSALKPVHARR